MPTDCELQAGPAIISTHTKYIYSHDFGYAEHDNCSSNRYLLISKEFFNVAKSEFIPRDANRTSRGQFVITEYSRKSMTR